MPPRFPPDSASSEPHALPAGFDWHKKHREAGEVPHTSIDTEAHWSKSGRLGSVYGWKLHLAAVVASVWIPLAAELAPANWADNQEAPALIRALPSQIRYVLGDVHNNDPDLRQLCADRNQELVATRRGAYSRTDGGVGVSRVCHKLRSLAMDNFNEHIKSIFRVPGAVPTEGSGTLSTLPWVPFWSTSWPRSIDTSIGLNSMSVSSPFFWRPDVL